MLAAKALKTARIKALKKVFWCRQRKGVFCLVDVEPRAQETVSALEVGEDRVLRAACDEMGAFAAERRERLIKLAALNTTPDGVKSLLNFLDKLIRSGVGEPRKRLLKRADKEKRWEDLERNMTVRLRRNRMGVLKIKNH